MGRSERETDAPLDAAIVYLRTGDHPLDPKLGKFIDGSFIPAANEPKPTAPQVGILRRFLKSLAPYTS